MWDLIKILFVAIFITMILIGGFALIAICIDKADAVNIESVETVINFERVTLTDIDRISDGDGHSHIYLNDGTKYTVLEYKVNRK